MLRPRTQSALRRFIYTDSWSKHTLHEWLRTREKNQQLRDVVSAHRLKRLFDFLPTRNPNDFGTNGQLTSAVPQIGDPVSLGYHLVLLPDNYKDQLLRPDGSTSWHAPPSPWTRRQWSGGKIWSSVKSPLLVGLRFIQKRAYLDKKWAYIPKELNPADNPPLLPSIHVKQKMVVSQWHSQNTELLSEERLTEYHTEPYDLSQIKTSSLVPQSGTLSFAFNPTPFMLYSFSSLCNDKHRIHFDLEYAKQEGYPDLVVQVQLQLILILETLAAHLPEGLVIRGLDYTVVNPLFAGSEIGIYSDDLSVEIVSDMPSDLISKDPENLESQPIPGPEKVQTPPPSRRRNPTRQERNTKRKRTALLWTAADNGAVGVVAKVGLQKRPKTETLDDLPWRMDRKEGYLVHMQEPPGATVESHDCAHSLSPKDSSARNRTLPSQPQTGALSLRLQDSVKFDPSGKPIMDQISHHAPVTLDQQWLSGENDAAAMEQERLQRKKKATDIKTHEFFERLFTGAD